MIEKSHDDILVRKVSEAADLQNCLLIRHQVFVEGQNVPIHEEVDGLDESSEHYLLYLKKRPVGTARVRYREDFAKIERVAILEAYQGQGLGHRLMGFILEDIRKNPQAHKAKLGSQTYAIPFYEKLGFSVCSDEYLDAGIPHKNMQLSFNNVVSSRQMPTLTKSSIQQSPHFHWGDGCEGWWLKKIGNFTVILEIMLPSTTENKHYHRFSEQHFFCLSEILSIQVEQDTYHLNPQEGLTICAGMKHTAHNAQQETVRFLVISSPDSHEDRVEM